MNDEETAELVIWAYNLGLRHSIELIKVGIVETEKEDSNMMAIILKKIKERNERR